MPHPLAMSITRKFRWSVRTAALAVLPAALLTLFIPRAEGLPPVSWTKWYYSDSDFQNWVGEKTLWCDGSRYQEGTQTGYSLVVVTEGCSGGAPDGIRETNCFVYWPGSGIYSNVPCH